MNKETFDKIQTTLEDRIAACQSYLNNIETTDDLKKLTIEDAQKLQRFCRQEEAYMTKLVQCDLYHIIGMGELTPPQMMKFIYHIKGYLHYRGTIKTLAMNLDKISVLPGLPTSAVYKTHSFDELVLYSGPDYIEGVIDLPYDLNGNILIVKADKLSKFVSFWSKMSKSNYSFNNLQEKAKAGAEYGGIQWSVLPYGDYEGVCTSCPCFAGFVSHYRSAQKNN